MGWDPRELYCWPSARDLRGTEDNMRVGKPAGTTGPAPHCHPRGHVMSQGEPTVQGDKVLKKEGFHKKTRDLLLNSSDVIPREDTLVLYGHKESDSAPYMEAPRASQVSETSPWGWWI